MMKLASGTESDDRQVGSIRGMSAALPKGKPRQVIAALERVFHMGVSHLPPQVFFETVEQSAIAISSPTSMRASSTPTAP